MADIATSDGPRSCQHPDVTSARALLSQASGIVELFLAANSDNAFLLPADHALSEFCESEGADNVAAAMAALCELTLLTWSQSTNYAHQQLLERVRRRIDGDGPSPALVPA